MYSGSRTQHGEGQNVAQRLHCVHTEDDAVHEYGAEGRRFKSLLTRTASYTATGVQPTMGTMARN